MDILEKEAATKLRKLGLKSSWGCNEGVFLSSEDAFKVIRVLKALNVWILPQTVRKSFNEVREILKTITERSDVADSVAANKNDGLSGKGAYKSNGVSEIDLG